MNISLPINNTWKKENKVISIHINYASEGIDWSVQSPFKFCFFASLLHKATHWLLFFWRHTNYNPRNKASLGDTARTCLLPFWAASGQTGFLTMCKLFIKESAGINMHTDTFSYSKTNNHFQFPALFPYLRWDTFPKHTDEKKGLSDPILQLGASYPGRRCCRESSVHHRDQGMGRPPA